MLIEKAVAFHGYDSIFMWMVDLMNMGCEKYAHTYVRSYICPNEHCRLTYIKQLRAKWTLVE